MLKIKSTTKIYCNLEPVDMRKSIDGLNILIADQGQEHGNDSLYIFRNKEGNKVKIVFWDRNGFVLYYKRLERRRFKFPLHRNEYMELSEQQLTGLLLGLEFELLSDFDDYNFTDFS